MRDDEQTGVTARRFSAIVTALGRDDPRFLRRVSVPRAPRISVDAAMILVGLVLTVVLGLLPLGVGLTNEIPVLLGLGAVGVVLLPFAGPLLTRLVISRVRPLWP